VTNISLLQQYLGKQIQTQGSVFVFRQVFSWLIQLVKGKYHKLGYYHEEKAKNEFALNRLNTKLLPKNTVFNLLVRFFSCHDAK